MVQTQILKKKQKAVIENLESKNAKEIEEKGEGNRKKVKTESGQLKAER